MVSSFLAMTGQFDVKNTDFKCLPSRYKIKKILIEFAVDCLLLLSDKVAGKVIFMTCDKGNKKGLGALCEGAVVVEQHPEKGGDIHS